MNGDFDLFEGTEKFYSILKKLEMENRKIFEDAKVSYDECCVLFSQNNKISLVEVNNKLPISIKYLIETEWEEFCKNSKD